jgi:hypothetical protein
MTGFVETRTPMANQIRLTPAAVKLLRAIAKHGDAGVVFYYAPPGQRWRMDGTNYVVSRKTFLQVSSHPVSGGVGLVDVGDDGGDPVRITAAGRAWLEANT